MLPIIAHHVDGVKPGIFLTEGRDLFPAPIKAAVVYQDYFVILAQGGERTPQASQKRLQTGFAVVNGDNNRKTVYIHIKQIHIGFIFPIIRSSTQEVMVIQIPPNFTREGFTKTSDFIPLADILTTAAPTNNSPPTCLQVLTPLRRTPRSP